MPRQNDHTVSSNIVFIVCQAQNWVLRHWKWCFPLASFSCSQDLRLQKLLDDQTFIGHFKSWMIMFERDQTWENHLNGMPREVALRSFSTMLDENLWSLSPGLLRCSHKVFLIDCYVLDWLTGPSSASINELTSQKWAVRELESAAFKCTVGGSPRPNVTWIRGKEIIADCDGRQYGKCNNRGNSRYKVQWKDERGCMLSHSMGQVSGTWISSLRFPNTRFPADAMEYACVVSNGIGPARRQNASLEIYG